MQSSNRKSILDDKGHIFAPSQTKYRGLYYEYYPTIFYLYDIICVVILSVAKDLKVYTGFESMC